MFSDVESFSETASLKKTNKPLMEKKRRARINRCLTELKDILIKDNHVSASHAKWEKADILEMTVEYVKKMRSAKGINDLKRPAPSVLEDHEDKITTHSKSPLSACSPPSTSSTEFSDPPEAKKPRRLEPEAGTTLPHAPIATYPGIQNNFLAHQIFLAQLQNQTNFKMAAMPPILPMHPFTTGSLPTVPLSPWR